MARLRHPHSTNQWHRRRAGRGEGLFQFACLIGSCDYPDIPYHFPFGHRSVRHRHLVDHGQPAPVDPASALGTPPRHVAVARAAQLSLDPLDFRIRPHRKPSQGPPGQCPRIMADIGEADSKPFGRRLKSNRPGTISPWRLLARMAIQVAARRASPAFGNSAKITIQQHQGTVTRIEIAEPSHGYRPNPSVHPCQLISEQSGFSVPRSRKKHALFSSSTPTSTTAK